jgi:NADPH:quinone reductase-like Zn-dependent oxidoreductase
VAEKRTIAGARRTPGHVRRDDRRERRHRPARAVREAADVTRFLHRNEGEAARSGAALFAGELKPVVGTFPLAEAAAAQRRLERSEQFGKIVLEVG